MLVWMPRNSASARCGAASVKPTNTTTMIAAGQKTHRCTGGSERRAVDAVGRGWTFRVFSGPLILPPYPAGAAASGRAPAAGGADRRRLRGLVAELDRIHLVHDRHRA